MAISSVALEQAGNMPIALSPSDVKDFVLCEDGEIPSWEEAAYRLRTRLSTSPHTNRFSPEWARQQQARILTADEQLREFANSTALLTFTGSSRVHNTEKNLWPATSYLSALTSSRSARRNVLREILQDLGTDRWVAIRVLAPSQSGYPHTHVALGTDQDLSESDWKPVIDAHVDECPIATKEAHNPTKAIRIQSDPSGEPVGAIGYITPQIPGMEIMLNDSRVEKMPENRARTAAVLEATGTEAVRIDSGVGVNACWS